MLEALIVVVFPLVVAYAAATDFLTMTIANRVSIVLVLAFFCLAPLIGMDWATLGWHVAASSLVFAIGFGCFAMGWIGGGDVKFAAAVVLWLGWSEMVEYIMLFSVFGGVLTVLTLLSTKFTTPLPTLQVGFLARFAEHRRVPYGIALAAAALMLYPETIWMKALWG